MLDLENKILTIVKNETVPAVGCTEPIAVAYAASVAKKYFKGSLDNLSIHTSRGIFKNGKSVKIPNTEVSGLDLAAALGFLSGNPKDELLVLDSVTDGDFEKAKDLLNKNLIKVEFLEESPEIYVEILAENSEEKVCVILKDAHNHIDKVLVNGETIYNNPINSLNSNDDFIKDLTFIQIQSLIENIDINKILFIEDGIRMNKEAAEKGLQTGFGLQLGNTLNRLSKNNLISSDAATKARILTAAAADVRMGGDLCPIMTSAGSGNQGLGVILPITVIAEEHNIDRERFLRGVFFAHIINKYVKLYTGKLSYMCGCAIGAGIGSTAAISWMLGGSSEQIAGACINMLSNLTGMFCDGAKESCALKLSTSAAESVLAAYLANEDVIIENNTGIIGNNIEESIKNIGSLCDIGHPYMDPALINIMDR